MKLIDALSLLKAGKILKSGNKICKLNKSVFGPSFLDIEEDNSHFGLDVPEENIILKFRD